MRKRELERLEVIQKALGGRMRQKEAAEKLKVCTRQVRRIMAKVRVHGAIGIIHGNRGKPSPRRYPEEFQERVMNLVEEHYADFGPTLAAEKLAERDQVTVNRETLRQWMIEKRVWVPRKDRESGKLYSWRTRKECKGEMVQSDGSVHDWLEGRGPRLVLMAYIDDATGDPFARFYPQETTHAALDSLRRYVEIYGIPQSLYFDRNSIYKTTRQASVEEQLQGQSPKTQFEMVLDILKVDAIFAFSPQAKGRIERLFKTFQDRLIKEMRLARIRTLQEANAFLQEYLPKYRAAFVIPARNPKDLHRPIPADLDLDWVFAFREQRVIANDFTIAWNNRTFLITHPSAALKNQRITVLENLQGQVRIWGHNRFLQCREITRDTLRQIRQRAAARRASRKRVRSHPWKPPLDHPWRRQNKAILAELYAGSRT